MATKTPKTEVSAREVIRARAAELRAKREETIVPPTASVEVAPTAVEVVSALASVEVAPTVVEFTAPTEENTMNTADTTPNTPEVPDAERIVQLLDLHAGIESDIEDLEAKLEALEARREEIYGSLEVYRSELDGSKLTDEQAQEKLAEIKAGLMVKFGPMAKFIVPALFDGFAFSAPASLDLDPTTGARLCELLDVGSGASAKADFSPMVRALTAHVLSVAEASEMTDTVKPKLNAVLLEMGLVKMAPPVAGRGAAKSDDDAGKVLARKNFTLPGYPDIGGRVGAAGKVYVSAKGTNQTGFGGKSAQEYLKRVNHPNLERGLKELAAMVDAWGVAEGLVP